LKLNNISYEREYVLSNKRFDFKVNNALIEINPYPTHNSTWGIYGTPLDPKYHFEKTKIAQKNGYRCIHVWDWDDIDKVIMNLSNKTTVYARVCDIKELSKKECDEFLNKYHYQNSCKGQKFIYGLYYNGLLIQVMTFGKPRYNMNFDYELLRLCTHPKYLVVGGSNRLFNHFIQQKTPRSIISYCDMSKFSGDVYKRLGFELLHENPPSKHWYNGKTHITNNLLKQRGFDQLFKTNYGKNISNKQLMLDHKFVEIYDCGQSTFMWNKSIII